MNNRVKLTQAAVLTTLAVVICLMSVYIPFLGLLIFIIPVPYAIIATMTGGKYALISAIISFFMIMFTVDPIYAFYLTIMSILPGLAVGYKINKDNNDEEEKNFKPIYFGTIAFMISIVVFAIVSKLAFKIDIVAQFIEISKLSVETQFSIMKSMNIEMNKDITVQDVVNLTQNIIPTMLFVYSIISSSITYYLEAFILRRIKKLDFNLPKFNEFYLPGNAVTTSLLLYFLIMGLGMLKLPLHTDIIMLNLQLIFSMMFLVQGISVGIYFIKEWSKKSPKKIIIFVVGLFLLSGTMFLSLVGMLDSVIDFRKVRSYKST